MHIPMRHNRAEAITLEAQGCKDIVVEFFLDAVGNLRVASWCQGKALLFEANVSASDIAAPSLSVAGQAG